MLYQTTRSPELVGEVWRSVSHLATQEFTRFSARQNCMGKEGKQAHGTGDRHADRRPQVASPSRSSRSTRVLSEDPRRRRRRVKTTSSNKPRKRPRRQGGIARCALFGCGTGGMCHGRRCGMGRTHTKRVCISLRSTMVNLGRLLSGIKLGLDKGKFETAIGSLGAHSWLRSR